MEHSVARDEDGGDAQVRDGRALRERRIESDVFIGSLRTW